MAGKYSGPVRFIYQGAKGSARALSSMGRGQMGTMLNIMEKLNLTTWVMRRQYPSLKCVIETWASPSVRQITILVSASAEELDEACNAHGFLVQAPVLGDNAFLETPAYSVLLQNDDVNDLLGGHNNWYSEPDANGQYNILSWGNTKWKYFFEEYNRSSDIYYQGCLYATAPGPVQGAAIFEGQLVVVSNSNVYYTPFNPGTPYGVGGATWVEASPGTFVLSPMYTYIASPDGREWFSHYFDTPYQVQIFELTLDFDSQSGEVSISNATSGIVSGSVNTNSGYSYTAPVIDDNSSWDAGSYSDNSTAEYYYVDFKANPAYDGTNCSDTARCLSVTKHGPVSIPNSVGSCFGTKDIFGQPGVCGWWQTPPANTYRNIYAGVSHNVSYTALDESHAQYDICSGDATVTRDIARNGERWTSTWSAIGEYEVLKDYDKSGSLVKLIARRENGSSYYEEMGDYSRTRNYGSDIVSSSSYASWASARASELAADGQIFTQPLDESPCRDEISTGLSGGWVYVYGATYGSYPQVTTTGFQDWSETSNYQEKTRVDVQVDSLMAGQLIILYGQHYDDSTTTTSTASFNATYYYSGAVSPASWNPPLVCSDTSTCSYTWNWLAGCGSVPTDVLDTTESVSYTSNGSSEARLYMEVDLKEKIALIAETIGTAAGSGGGYTWKTSLYWHTPVGRLTVFADRVGKFLDNPQHYKSQSLPDFCYYPYAKKQLAHVFDDLQISDFKAFIIPRDDEVMLYTEGTILGLQFRDVQSINTSAGTITAAVTTDLDQVISLIAAL